MNSAEYHFRLPFIHVRPSPEQTELKPLSELPGPPQYFVRGVLLTVAVLYFLIGLIFLSIVRPLRRYLMALNWVRRLRGWIGTLNRYAALILLVVPWLIIGTDQATRLHPV